jgi:hypothetical protein
MLIAKMTKDKKAYEQKKQQLERNDNEQIQLQLDKPTCFPYSHIEINLLFSPLIL